MNILTKLIAAAVVIATNVHDSQAADGLVQAGDVVMHGDSAYVGQPVVVKGENLDISGTQAGVEHAFAVMSGQAVRIF